MSGSAAIRRKTRISLLETDPGLGRYAGSAGRERLEQIRVECVELRPGRLDLGHPAFADVGLGLVIVSGLLARRLAIAGGVGMNLYSTSDLIQPQVEVEHQRSSAEWLVLAPSQMVVLGEEFRQAVSAVPGFGMALLERAQTSEARAAAQLAILNSPRLEAKLCSLIWFLAEHWGDVDGDNASIRLDLTHQNLAMLVGAHRPSVSVALARLDSQGALRRAGSRWTVRRGQADRAA